VISGGETTVRVRGQGRGGRNLEFALALAASLAESTLPVAVASVGTDGIDGATDMAGGVVDHTSLARAAAAGVAAPDRLLDANDSLSFFAALGDAIRTGPTETNVGDLQIWLAA
jgi:hydroxypyruvate reductase